MQALNGRRNYFANSRKTGYSIFLEITKEKTGLVTYSKIHLQA
jgi:hypothetical protein